ncbi:efflux RND transporter periplasmic adaptor subunit [Niabella beijingensis]|uniref:efflux RND transporter periplasmic adaptor subunit n=1 Tax=Niabella beijingensis TaxID=2872700 RepID=UPI001CBDAD4F|nr:efflux RND transporter periplasmic adaptor subunit [Niabella beijingensis]MBZ4191738.1 efflux RND transporter periplasmic adaptor subunit [Niabella beijingensis]
MKKAFSIAIVLLITLYSCSDKNGNKASENPDPPEASGTRPDSTAREDNETTAILNEAQLKSVGIELGAIENKQLTNTLKVNGMLRVPHQNKASINSLYSGVIKAIYVQPGDHIRRGQTIATVTNPQFLQAQSEYLGTNARIQLAEQELKRQKDLVEGNAGALKNLQAAEANLRTLQTQRATLAQQIRLMGVNPAGISNGRMASVLAITSPISGVVSTIGVEMGSYVDISTMVAQVIDNSSLHVDLYVFEKDLPKVKDNQQIHFTITNSPDREYDARIFSKSASFEGETKAVTAHAKVTGDKTGLIDGMNITAVISLDKNVSAAVPAEAVVQNAGQDYIFVLKEKKTDAAKNETDYVFEKIPVAKGTTDVGFSGITPLKPIAPDAKIVTRGAFFVMAKLTNTGEEE